MRVLLANNTYWVVDYFQGRYGGLGHLFSPARKDYPRPHLPYALDNGAYSDYKHNRPFGEQAWREHLDRFLYHSLRPSWIVVPDVVADDVATLESWAHYAPELLQHQVPLAFAVQDGMEGHRVRQIEPQPDVIFVGGSTEWKWQTVERWCGQFPRVHVGRVNTDKQLRICQAAGAESVDGTGYLRGDPKQIEDLGLFLMHQAGKDEPDHVAYIVKHSRIKNRDQLAFPLEATA